MTKLCPFQQRIRRAVDHVLETEGQPRCLRDQCGLWIGDPIDGECAFVVAAKALAAMSQNKETTLKKWVEYNE